MYVHVCDVNHPSLMKFCKYWVWYKITNCNYESSEPFQKTGNLGTLVKGHYDKFSNLQNFSAFVSASQGRAICIEFNQNHAVDSG